MQPEVNNPQPSQPVQQGQPQVPTSKPKKSGHGKKIFAIFLILILTVGSGVTVWWYASSQTQKANEAEIADLQKQVDDLKKASNSQSEAEANDADSAKTLVVKEWDVKFDISEAPTGIRYVINKTDGDGSVYETTAETLSWYASEKDALGGSCANENSNTVSITRSTKSSVVIMERAVKGTKVGDSYYYIESSLGGGSCSDPVKEDDSEQNSSTVTKELKIHKQFIAVSKTIQEN